MSAMERVCSLRLGHGGLLPMPQVGHGKPFSMPQTKQGFRRGGQIRSVRLAQGLGRVGHIRCVRLEAQGERRKRWRRCEALRTAREVQTAVEVAQEEAATTSSSDVVLLDVEGMMCGGCVARVRSLLNAQEFVDTAAVNMLTETAAIRFHPSSRPIEDLTSELAAHLTTCGFPSKLRTVEEGSVVAKREENVIKKREALNKSTAQVAFAWSLVALCCGSHGIHLLHSLGIHLHGPVLGWLHNPLWKCSIASVTLLGPARELVVDGFKALARRAPNMNSLVGVRVRRVRYQCHVAGESGTGLGGFVFR